MATIAEATQLAVEHQRAGRLDQAEQIYRQILDMDPKQADAWHLVGVLAYQRGKNDLAIEQIRKAIALQPAAAPYHNNLGLAYRASHQLAEARSCHEEALRLDAGYAAAHANLGYILREQSRLPEALDCYRQAIRLRPDYAAAHHGLGVVFQDLGRLAEAVTSYDEALRLQPAMADAHYHRAEALEDLGQLQEALDGYQQAVRCQPGHVDAFHSAGCLLENLGRNDEAQEWRLRPFHTVADDGARIRALLATPHVFVSEEQMRSQRRSMENALSALEQVKLSIADPLTEVNATNFYSAYHGLNDRDLQVRLAALHARATPSLMYVSPYCREPGGDRAGGELRVGFISNFLHMHTIGEVNLGFIRNLSREICRVILLQPPGPNDDVARLIRASADQVVTLPVNLAAAREIIAQQQLDVLFYTDIGMDPFTYYLAFARLARVQCTTWGHPETTGIPTIDYYISGVDLEPPGADEHYSERLIRLRSLPTYYHKLSLLPPARTRRFFGLEDDDHLYLCSQAPFKLHPSFDAMLGKILRADPRGRLLFIRGQNPQWTHQLLRRFHRSLPGLMDRISFIPHQSGRDYMHLLTVCDVLLDSTHFGGGNTHFKAFTVGAAVVTLPGAFARSRVASACYRKIGVLDCIAADEADYVRIALRLGTDAPWRDEIRRRIREASPVLFEDDSVVRELEQFFVQATSQNL
jgi:protein O-GlcNAc transferase